jgi:hypothetical protein
MIRIGNVWINPVALTHAIDEPSEDSIMLFLGGVHTCVLRGDDRQRVLGVLRERQVGTLDDLRERAHAAAALLPRKED